MPLRNLVTSSVLLLALFSGGLFLASCEDKARVDASPPTEAEKLLDRGRVIYVTQCIACHAQDPHQNGGVGPAIAGSPVELVRSKVLKNEYPAGYQPKRQTKTMIALPHLEKDIEAIAAYLNK